MACEPRSSQTRSAFATEGTRKACVRAVVRSSRAGSGQRSSRAGSGHASAGASERASKHDGGSKTSHPGRLRATERPLRIEERQADARDRGLHIDNAVHQPHAGRLGSFVAARGLIEVLRRKANSMKHTGAAQVRAKMYAAGWRACVLKATHPGARSRHATKDEGRKERSVQRECGSDAVQLGTKQM